VLRTLNLPSTLHKLGRRDQIPLLLQRELNVIDGQKKPMGKHQRSPALPLPRRATIEIWPKLRATGLFAGYYKVPRSFVYIIISYSLLIYDIFFFHNFFYSYA